MLYLSLNNIGTNKNKYSRIQNVCSRLLRNHLNKFANKNGLDLTFVKNCYQQFIFLFKEIKLKKYDNLNFFETIIETNGQFLKYLNFFETIIETNGQFLKQKLSICK